MNWIETALRVPATEHLSQVNVLMYSEDWACPIYGMCTRVDDDIIWSEYDQTNDCFNEWPARLTPTHWCEITLPSSKINLERKSMKTVRVFPDYMSSGFWASAEDGHGMYEADTLGLSTELVLAVKYWHILWELSMDSFKGCKMSDHLFDTWFKDGQLLVAIMNEQSNQNEITFVYDTAPTKSEQC